MFWDELILGWNIITYSRVGVYEVGPLEGPECPRTPGKKVVLPRNVPHTAHPPSCSQSGHVFLDFTSTPSFLSPSTSTHHTPHTTPQTSRHTTIKMEPKIPPASTPALTLPTLTLPTLTLPTLTLPTLTLPTPAPPPAHPQLTLPTPAPPPQTTQTTQTTQATPTPTPTPTPSASPTQPPAQKTPGQTPGTPQTGGRPAGTAGRTQLKPDDLVRIQTLSRDARMGPSEIRRVTGYSIHQIKYALKKKTPTVGKRSGRPRKDGGVTGLTGVTGEGGGGGEKRRRSKAPVVSAAAAATVAVLKAGSGLRTRESPVVVGDDDEEEEEDGEG